MGVASALGISGGALGGIAAGIGSIFGARSASKSAKRAAKAQGQAQDKALAATEQAVAQARRDAIPLFESGFQNQQQGFQGALDIFGQTIPGQINAFQGGNQNAQNTLLAGLDPQIAAILGGNINLSGLQAQQAPTPDMSIFQQQLPQFTGINDALNLNRSVDVNSGQPQVGISNPNRGFNDSFNRRF